ncbi:MAG: phosphoribosylamine--glycine ligase [Alphaproteobacteria bacterium]|nr:phosphoribosylamine--glycine ligase [Alphaproteobacteria bacterium]
MNILLIGAGGREHALTWKLSQSSLCEELFVTPGSDAIGQEPKTSCVELNVKNHTEIVEFCLDKDIGLVVVGPEIPLVDGLADSLEAAEIPVFGPSKEAAQLEGSKGFMKDLCKKYDIPTAAYERFTEINPALAYIEAQGAPIVVKADGLAAGKGVIVAETVEQAKQAVTDMLSGNAFDGAGSSVVIEEFLDGEEVSFFAISDGERILPLTSAQDYKRAFDGDKGPNTGGMGAYSPARAAIWSPELERIAMERVIKPTADAMSAEGMPFKGIYYAGLMIVHGKPHLIEYNVRFGDPECQAIMMRLESDLGELLYDAAIQNLTGWKKKLSWSDDHAMCVVMAANGYPESYEKGTAINGLDKIKEEASSKVFHAGTKNENGQWVSNGGRVLSVTAMGETLEVSKTKTYDIISCIQWPDGFYRKDIGWRTLSNVAND